MCGKCALERSEQVQLVSVEGNFGVSGKISVRVLRDRRGEASVGNRVSERK